MPPRSIAFEERLELVRAARVTELAQRLCFDLANPLTRHVELLADFLERVIGAHLDAEAHAQHLRFARRQRIEHVLHHIAHARVQRSIRRRNRVRILDEVAQMGIVVVADRRFHRDRLLRDLHDLADLVFRHLHLFGERCRIRLETGFLQNLTRDAVHLVDRFDHVNRNPDRARLVRDRTRDRLANPPRGVRRELVAAAIFELVHRLHQTDVAFLNQIEELQATVRVLLRDRDHETQVRLGHFALRLTRLQLAGGHLAIGFLQVLERQHDTRLQIEQALLLFADRRDVARQNRAIRMALADDLFRPVEVRFVARETRDEFRTRHTALVDHRMQDLALDLTHFVHLRAQRIAQALDGTRGEADRHQLFLNRLLRFQVSLRLVAFLLERATHLVEPLADERELLERRTLQGFELSCVGRRLRGAVVLFLFFLFFLFGVLFFVLDRFGFLRREAVGIFRVRVDQAVNEFVDADFLVRDTLGHRKDVGDRGRARGDGHHHVLQAIFDAFRDFDLAFAREQLDRAHFAHVHADGIGRAAEFGIDRRQRDFGFLFDFIVRRRRGRVVVQEQRFGIGGLFVDRHAHVVERADDAFDRFGLREVIGEVVVDFRVREEPALLAELDERAQLRAALFEFFGRARLRRRKSVLQERFFLRATIACLGLFAFARSGLLLFALGCVVIDGYFVQLFRHGVRRTGYSLDSRLLDFSRLNRGYWSVAGCRIVRHGNRAPYAFQTRPLRGGFHLRYRGRPRCLGGLGHRCRGRSCCRRGRGLFRRRARYAGNGRSPGGRSCGPGPCDLIGRLH